MNRLRRAYRGLEPGLERYFTSGTTMNSNGPVANVGSGALRVSNLPPR
jgi:hypothetical protein